MSTRPPSNARQIGQLSTQKVRPPSEIEIRGTDIDKLLIRALSYIREESRRFYYDEILHDLRRKGESLVDRHAGQGRYIKIILEK